MTAGIRTIAAGCAAVLLLGTTAARAQTAEQPPLVPLPASITEGVGSFAFVGEQVNASDAGTRAAAERLAELLMRGGHAPPAFAQSGRIGFLRDNSIDGEEAYRLEITPDGVKVSAATDAGLYYGAQTLYQLMASARDSQLAAMTIEDGPAYEWRGVMLDSARHFQPASYVRELIDRMAMLKLNRLHWHLTDDQGWRLPIPDYPRLTSVGGWRQQAGFDGFDPESGEPRRYGGFYTEEEIRDVVAYAASRHIEIVPEIDMPGHMTAAIAAYPALASTPNPPVSPSHDWGILPNLINPGPYGMSFTKAVLDQVMRLFPGEVIHIGGDEAVKDQWAANPAIQAQIDQLGLKDAHELQAWFTGQLSTYLAEHGRRAIGWDEVLDGPLPPDAIVMSWRGIEGAVAAARRGHDTVLAPAPVFYMDNRQSASDLEPPGRGEIISWRRLYEADTKPATLSADELGHIRGLQINLWTEHVRTIDYTNGMLWPRAAVLAEMGWSSAPRDWQDFAPRLLAQMERDSDLGLQSNQTPLEAMASFTKGTGQATIATLTQPADLGTLRYTLDGSPPVSTSAAYTVPLELAPGTRLMAQAFDGSSPLASARGWTVSPALAFTRLGNDLEQCTSKLPIRMEDDAPSDGVRKVHFADVMNPCWKWTAAPLDGVTRIAVDVVARPYNFELHDAIKSVTIAQAESGVPVLRLRLDDCEGPEIATLSLAPVEGKPGVNRVEGTLDRGLSGNHDLCVTFAQKGFDPLWMLDRLTLVP